jgi:Kef-type K+ transport system membrane component KefB
MTQFAEASAKFESSSSKIALGRDLNPASTLKIRSAAVSFFVVPRSFFRSATTFFRAILAALDDPSLPAASAVGSQNKRHRCRSRSVAFNGRDSRCGKARALIYDASERPMPTGTDTLLLELFAIFVWAKVFGEVFEQMSLPAVLGEILSGIVLGPYATGLVTPTDTVSSIAEIGAIFLLFTVGLETRPQDLIRVGQTSLRVAIAGVIVPFVLGLLFMKMRHQQTHEAIFVAAAMVATSVGITARVLRDLHVLGTRTARIILGAAVFDDILGMIILAVVAGIASGGSIRWLHLGVVTAEAVGFACFMLFYGPRLVNRLRPGMERMSSHDAPLILALAICLGLSVAASRIGMAAIIGAFFAGLVFADYSPEWNLLPRAHAINEFLAPFFFFTMGARLNVQVFNSKILFVALIVSVLAIISKVAGCGLPVIKEGWQSCLRVGVGMTPRGEVALIVALIGLQMKMISQNAYAIVIVMTGVTTMLAPPLLRLLYHDEIASPEEMALETAEPAKRE